MKKETLFYIISHTHWDREWYLPFEIMRKKLVSLIDNLLDILEKDKGYIFHLDQQTVVLEDYLAIRPHKAHLLKKYIALGNILAGPWYIQNDFYLSSGEATVRNLLIGFEESLKFGAVNRAGYAPDQFGIISQLPQILKGFDIDSLVFARGYHKYYLKDDNTVDEEIRPCEFLWEGADGSTLLAIYMKNWYNNAQRIPADLRSALYLLDTQYSAFKDLNITPYILLMNGVDHLEAQDDLTDIIAKINLHFGSEKIRQCRMDNYIADVKKYLNKNSSTLSLIKGELRSGHDWQLLKSCLSSRVYLKVLSARALSLIEGTIEPLYSMLSLCGDDEIYDADYFKYLWKCLLKNLAHDSICGCSHDAVHAHMEDSYARFFEAAEYFLQEGKNIVSQKVTIEGSQSNDYKIIICNTRSFELNETVFVTAEFPTEEKVKAFKIQEGEREIPFDIIKKYKRKKEIYSPLNLPGIIDTDCYDICFVAEAKPYSFKGYIIKKDRGINAKKKNTNLKQISNGILTLSYSDGKLLLTDREGNLYLNPISFEDSGDIGDAYVRRIIPGDDSIFPAKLNSVAFKEYTEYSECHAYYDMYLPMEYNYETKARSTRSISCPIKIIFSLKHGDPYLGINYSIKNNAKNHRLRLKIDTKVTPDCFYSDNPYDIVKHDDKQNHPQTMSKTFCNNSFAFAENDVRGIAVFTEGQHETEYSGGSLYITLVRATGYISSNAEGYSNGGYNWHVPEGQCLRILNGKIALMPYAGGYLNADILRHSHAFRCPPITIFDSCDYKKFTGGRPAVQDTMLKHLYFAKDEYPLLKIPCDESLFNVYGQGISVTCVKRAEKSKDIVIRVCNYSQDESECMIEYIGKIFETNLAESEKKILGNGSVRVNLRPKQIYTVILENF